MFKQMCIFFSGRMVLQDFSCIHFLVGFQWPKNDIFWLFDPFYRRDSARSGEGFGLGLASARSIVTSHGWSIEAGTPDERTVEFTIRIPLTR